MRVVATLLLTLLLLGCGDNDSLEDYLARSAQYIHSGDFVNAREDLRLALRLDPGSAEGRFLLGKLHFVTDASESAAEELARAEALGWPVDRTRPLIARSLLAQGKFEQALALRPLGLSNEASAQLLSVQVLAAILDGDEARARDLEERARISAPDDIEMQLLDARIAALRQRYDAALDAVETVLAAEPGSAEALRLRAHILLRQERPRDALDAFNETIDIARNDFGDRVARAAINIRLGEMDDVKADVTHLQALAPDHPSVKYLAGLVAFYVGDDDQAVFNLEAARPVSDRYPLVLFYLALTHLFESDGETAESYAREFVDLLPDNIRGRKLLAALLLHNGDHDEVEAVLQPVLDFNPGDLDALGLLAQTLAYVDRANHALTLYLRMSQVDPTQAVGEVPVTAGFMNTPLDLPRAAAVEAMLSEPIAFPRDDVLKIHARVVAGDYPGALERADSLRWRDTLGIAPYNLQAELMMLAGQPEQARDVLSRAIKRKPGDASVNLSLGKFARIDGDLREERERYRAVLNSDPANIEVLLASADMEGREGDNNALLGNLQQAFDLNPTALAPRLAMAQYFLSRDRPQRIIGLFDDLPPLSRRAPRAIEMVARAQLALGHPEAAYISLLELAIDDAVTPPARYQLLATAALAVGEEETAVMALEEALVLAPDYVPAQRDLARLQLASGDSEGVLRSIARLRTLTPGDPFLLRLEAQWPAMGGKVDLALANSEALHAEQPTSETVLQIAQLQDALGDSEAAEKTLRDWIEAEAGDVAVQLALAQQLSAREQAEEKRQAYARVLELDPDNVQALNNLAWLLREEAPGKSLTYSERAVSLAPESPTVLDTHAVIELLNGRLEQAEQTIGRALQRRPNRPGFRYHQAMIHAALGREESARAQLQALLQPGAEAFAEETQARALLAELSASGGE